MAVVRQGRVWFLFIGYRLCVDKIAIWKTSVKETITKEVGYQKVEATIVVLV